MTAQLHFQAQSMKLGPGTFRLMEMKRHQKEHNLGGMLNLHRLRENNSPPCRRHIYWGHMLAHQLSFWCRVKINHLPTWFMHKS